jgi:hypothetical protein
VAVARSGNVFVSDFAAHRIVKLSARGKALLYLAL